MGLNGEYPISKDIYITNNYTIEVNSSLKINISLTIREKDNETEGGYCVISDEILKSEEPFYWPDILEDNGKLTILSNMEIIESDLLIRLSSYPLMRKRENI